MRPVLTFTPSNGRLQDWSCCGAEGLALYGASAFVLQFCVRVLLDFMRHFWHFLLHYLIVCGWELLPLVVSVPSNLNTALYWDRSMLCRLFTGHKEEELLSIWGHNDDIMPSAPSSPNTYTVNSLWLPFTAPFMNSYHQLWPGVTACINPLPATKWLWAVWHMSQDTGQGKWYWAAYKVGEVVLCWSLLVEALTFCAVNWS